MSRLPRALWWSLAALLVVRLLVAALISPPVVGDAQGYTASARRLLDTGSFAYPMYGETFWTRSAEGDLVFRGNAQASFNEAPPNAFTMPGYPLFVAAIWGVTGGADPWLAVRLVHAVLSVLAAGLVFLLARRFGERVAWLALTAAALYPPFTLANSYIGTEVLFLFLLTATVALLLRWRDTGHLGHAISAGLLGGAGFLVRPTAILWVAGAVMTVVAVAPGNRRRMLGQALALAVAGTLIVGPWLVRNYTLYGKPLAVGTSSGGNVIQGFWQDSHDRVTWPWDRDGVRYSDEDRRIAAITETAYAAGPQHETDDRPMLEYFGPASQRLTRELLTEYPLAVAKARLASTAASLAWPHAVSPAPLGGIPFTVSWLVHLLLLATSLAGLALGSRRFEWLLLASVPLYFVAVHALVFPLWRYYFPALACGMVLAAIGIDQLLTRATGQRGMLTP